MFFSFIENKLKAHERTCITHNCDWQNDDFTLTDINTVSMLLYNNYKATLPTLFTVFRLACPHKNSQPSEITLLSFWNYQFYSSHCSSHSTIIQYFEPSLWLFFHHLLPILCLRWPWIPNKTRLHATRKASAVNPTAIWRQRCEPKHRESILWFILQDRN